MSLSKNQARKAARHLVQYLNSDADVDELSGEAKEKLYEALTTTTDWRASFARPLLSVRMSLQSFAKTKWIAGARVTQRHKRLPRIIRKLQRLPSMQITTMGDIGGCRIVVPTLAEVRTIQSHAKSTWGASITRELDYVEEPKPDGYRAVHIVIRRNDRLIEVQIRTTRQQAWAGAVERVSRNLGTELKWGEGPESLRTRLTLVSESLAELDDAELPVDPNEWVEIIAAVTENDD